MADSKSIYSKFLAYIFVSMCVSFELNPQPLHCILTWWICLWQHLTFTVEEFVVARFDLAFIWSSAESFQFGCYYVFSDVSEERSIIGAHTRGFAGNAKIPHGSDTNSRSAAFLLPRCHRGSKVHYGRHLYTGNIMCIYVKAIDTTGVIYSRFSKLISYNPSKWWPWLSK